MSYQIGMDALHLRPTPRLAHTEYCSNDALKRAVTGLEPDDAQYEATFYRLWDYDFIWATHDGPEPWEERGRVTDMGHSEFLEGGVDWRPAQPCPFRSVEEALAFDAVAEYGLTEMQTLVSFYRQRYAEARTRFPEQVWTGGYYRTLFSGAIAIFGWEMLLQAAAERGRFAKVLDSIFQQSLHHYRAWARTDIEVFMCHDDMVWTQGPFMRPDFYRAEIFPRYRALWQVLHVARYGQTHCLLASKVDARTLTFGRREQIYAEVDATLALAQQCSGFIFAVGNHIPSNVPVENALDYMAYLRSRWGRDAW
mgnify:CR=1 FL=1